MLSKCHTSLSLFQSFYVQTMNLNDFPKIFFKQMNPAPSSVFIKQMGESKNEEENYRKHGEMWTKSEWGQGWGVGT